MRFEICVKYIGFIVLIIGVSIILSALVGYYFHDGSGDELMISGLLTCGIGIFPYVFVPKAESITIKESILIVSGVWVFGTIAGSMPFYLYGEPFNFIRAWFESVSGFTTTGSSILAAVEDLPKGTLFWRSFCQWIGGAGIIVFAVSILPAMDNLSLSVFRQEYSASGHPTYPRTKTSSMAILLVYAAITITEVAALLIAGIGIYDAVCIAFCTAATGGYAVRNCSIAAYNNLAADIIIMVFMVIFSMSLVFLYGLFFQRKLKVAGWEAARLNLIILGIVTILVSVSLYGRIYHHLGETLRYASFTVISQSTTTGFATADDAGWPAAAQLLIVFVTLTGACSGSTAGALKTDRILVFIKLISLRIKKYLHPRIVESIRVDGNAVDMNAAKDAMLFIAAYLAILIVATILIAFMGVGMLEAFTGSAACLGNVGPGLGAVGSMGNFSGIPDLGIFILTLTMLIGRLEIFVFIIPFSRSFWKL